MNSLAALAGSMDLVHRDQDQQGNEQKGDGFYLVQFAVGNLVNKKLKISSDPADKLLCYILSPADSRRSHGVQLCWPTRGPAPESRPESRQEIAWASKAVQMRERELIEVPFWEKGSEFFNKLLGYLAYFVEL